MTESLEKDLKAFFEEQEQSGLMKKERVLQGRQQRSIAVAGGEVLNF